MIRKRFLNQNIENKLDSENLKKLRYRKNIYRYGTKYISKLKILEIVGLGIFLNN